MNALEHRIKAAQHEFICAESVGERRVKWRAWSTLIARQTKQLTEKGIGCAREKVPNYDSQLG